MNHPDPTDPLTSTSTATADVWRDPSIHVPLAAEPYSIAFHSAAQCVMTITKEGRLVPGEGLSPDEATQGMFKVLTRLWEGNNAYVEGLKKDKERLDWLEKECVDDIWPRLGFGLITIGDPDADPGNQKGTWIEAPTYREAIDAARAASECNP